MEIPASKWGVLYSQGQYRDRRLILVSLPIFGVRNIKVQDLISQVASYFYQAGSVF
jgi:hypothetical protein